jgi:hypothetical protein
VLSPLHAKEVDSQNSISSITVQLTQADLALAESDISLGQQIIDRLLSEGASTQTDRVISIVWHLCARIMLASG